MSTFKQKSSSAQPHSVTGQANAAVPAIQKPAISSIAMGTRVADSRFRGFRNDTQLLKTLAAVGQKVEPTTRFGEAEILRPLIPDGPCLRRAHTTRARLASTAGP